MAFSTRHLLVLLTALAVVTLGAGVAVAGAPPRLAATGPTDVDGVSATAVFEVADRTIRQVRYRDGHDLVYSFQLRNDGRLPVAVEGLAPLERAPRLFRYLRLEGPGSATEFDVPSGAVVPVRLVMRMESCETLSARAGSFATEMAVRTGARASWTTRWSSSCPSRCTPARRARPSVPRRRRARGRRAESGRPYVAWGLPFS